MFRLGLAVLFMSLPLMSSCSNEDVVNRLTSEEDRTKSVQFATALRDGDVAKLQGEMTPDAFAKTKDMIPKASEYLKNVAPNFKVIGYQWNEQATPKGNVSSRMFVLKAGEGKKWAKFDIIYEGVNGAPSKVAGWYVYPFEADPETVTTDQPKQQ